MRVSEDRESPLISVVIATRNRAEMLHDSLHSVLCQTYRNLEVLVVDDGSEDDTRGTVESLGDPRLRYLRQDRAGISAARNRGTEHARGSWIAVHDDDDLMLPARLEQQLAYADDAVDFVYGTFLNFDDETGALELHHGRNYGYGPALRSGFAPGHSTWLVRSDIMRSFPYDEGIESAVDNNVVLRMLRSGVRFRHSGVFCLLRRVHSDSITQTRGAGQKYVAGMDHAFICRGVSPEQRDLLVQASRRDWGPVDTADWQIRFLPFLPDHLVTRSGYVTTWREVPGGGTAERTPRTVELESVRIDGLTWWEFVDLCAQDVSLHAVRGRLRESADGGRPSAGADRTPALPAADPATDALSVLLTLVEEGSGADCFVMASAGSDEWTEEQHSLLQAQCVTDTGAGTTTFGIVPLRSLSAALALRDTVFHSASSVRIVSTTSPAEITAMLHASS